MEGTTMIILSLNIYSTTFVSWYPNVFIIALAAQEFSIHDSSTSKKEVQQTKFLDKKV